MIVKTCMEADVQIGVCESAASNSRWRRNVYSILNPCAPPLIAPHKHRIRLLALSQVRMLTCTSQHQQPLTTRATLDVRAH
jgi:hypothetical protein|eukprot:COSAG02_NODE_9_length_59728_cov_36.104714_7_plen_81_part_00